MSSVNAAAQNFLRLLDYEYHFVIGRKMKTVHICLKFDKTHFRHLCGLHKLKDIELLKQPIANRLLDQFISGQISDEQCRTSRYYAMIDGRIDLTTHLEEFLDCNDAVFKFSKKTNGYELNCDYILQRNTVAQESYVFIEEEKDASRKGQFFCKSCFPRGEDQRSKTEGHARFQLLHKTKVHLPTGEVRELFRAPSYRSS